MESAHVGAEAQGQLTRWSILLQSSFPGTQIEALQEIAEAVSNTTEQADSNYTLALTILPTVLATYARSFERPVRKEVDALLKKYTQLRPQDGKTTSVQEGIARYIAQESKKSGLAITNRLALLEWCTIILSEVPSSGTSQSQSILQNTIEAAAVCLDYCSAGKVRKGVRHAARVIAGRGLRRLFDKDEKYFTAAIGLLTGSNSAPANATYIGLAIVVADKSETHRQILSSVTSQVLDFYVKQILSAKSALPLQQVEGLNPFLRKHVTLKILSDSIVPALEKGILRSPENTLQGPIVALAESVSEEEDFSDLVASKLLKPIISALSSSNASVREGGANSLSSLLARKQSKALGAVVTELLTNIKSAKAANYELKGLLSDVIANIKPDVEIALNVCQSLAPVAAKETNEATLRREIRALSQHLVIALQAGKVDKSVADTMLKGCAEKRPAFKKIWILGLGSTLLSVTELPSASQDFVASSFKILQDAFFDISKNALPAVQAGIVSTALVLPALLRSSAVKSAASIKLPKVADLLKSDSFLLNPKVYTRLNTPDDQLWALRGLMGVTSALNTVESLCKAAWARAVLFLLTAPELASSVRKETGIELSKRYLLEPAAIGSSIILGLWDVLQEVTTQKVKTTGADETAPQPRLDKAVSCISPPVIVWEKTGLDVPQSVLDDQASSTVVLFGPDLLPGVDWIRNCLTIGVDPGSLASRKSSAMLTEIMRHFEPRKSTGLSRFENAACRAAATLAFVQPDTITPLIIKQLSADLAPSQLEGIGPEEAAMAKAPDGVLILDPLANANTVAESKSVKDYNLLKWEEEVRAQIAAKKGAPAKKLTPDQKAKVDAQMIYEREVREKVQGISANLRRGAGFVLALARGPPTDAQLWMAPAIHRISTALIAGAALIIDDELVNAYLACADKVQERIGSLRPFIGIAALRSFGSVGLPEEMEEEPLAELVMRVLYRLRFASEQRPFDAASLVYCLPIIFSVLDKGSVGKPATAEDADAQILLALEFLSFQMSTCTDPLLPRVAILQRLILSMQKYPQHYRLVKDSLISLSQALAATLTSEERDVLLSATTLPESAVRSATLQAIQSELELSDIEYSVNVWIACQDAEDENAELALAIWEENEFSITDELIDQIPAFLYDTAYSTRLSAAKALAQGLAVNLDLLDDTSARLQALYLDEAKPLVPKRNKFGIVQKGDLVDHWERRSGFALAFRQMASVYRKEDVFRFMNFLVSNGALSDRHGKVRNEMLEAGTAIVTLRGEESLEPLMQLFEKVLQGPDQASAESDMVNEAVIILYGSLAQHLPEGDSRLKSVLDKLVETLSTPSETVQYAVAECLPPLVRAAGATSDTYVTLLLEQLQQSKQYAARRGAAYGLAGIVKGKGLGALRQFRIMSALHSATENKKSPENREGALFAYELLSLILGRTFEPYVVEVLPQLLACFGDPVASVREACLDTAKTCFASLSSYGVHQVLPRLLEGLDETQWRSKKGACELLGAMAYLDSQQLANSLPDIIPSLTAVLTDSHKEVRAAANNSLKRFGEVISNPEVKSLVDVLLKALSDPTKYTDEALDALIKVSFIHYLDAPSLALVVRILERGLNDRSATKRKAAQIIGSLAHLTEKRDIITHLPILVTGLRAASIDPVPATRATASKALGSLVEKLGEDAFPDLIPSLMSSLRTDTGAGDRLGSAQALSEVLAGLGTGRLEETLPTILQNVQSARATVREGFMTLFIFLPACFGNSFANYLGQIIPSILGGLADEMEAIRDTALRAGRLLVKNFASKAIDLLLPELQRGLADDSYRIRLSSVELVGDLLFSLTGISSTAEAEEGDEKAAAAGKSLLEVLGEDRRNRVLSSLYICRCDTSGLVRAAAIAVWKALVATPRTLRELVPTLTQMIIQRLGSSNMEHKVIAGNALGEVIRKAGSGIFATLLPSLEDGLQSTSDSDSRQGICIALREVVNAAAPEDLEDHERRLVSIVRLALVDSDADVREAAAESFDALQSIFGKRAVDQVLPHLLNLLRSEDAENALSALLTLLTEASRANVILPNLIPTLLTDPITTFNARALASLAKVGGPSMNRRLPVILNTLADNIIACKDGEQKAELNSAFEAVLCSVDEYDGLNTAMSVMLAMTKHDDHHKRALAAHQLGKFFTKTEVDYSRYNQDLIRVLLISFDDRDKEVVKEAHGALTQLSSHLRKEEMESLVAWTSTVMKQVGTAGHNLPGFALPKGIQPVLAIFLQGLMNGTTDQKLLAANGISDIIDKTAPESLKLFVTQITGPLIRVVGERSVDVKCAIIVALNQLLEKIPTFLRPFLPQLQRTFTKCIADPTSELLRTRAVKALSTLITLTARIDPLIAELVAGVKTPDSGVRNAMLKGLQEVVSKVAANMSETSRDAILSMMDSQADAQDDMMVTLARLLGAMIKVLPVATAASLIKSRVLLTTATPASILALNAVLAESPKSLLPNYEDELQATILGGISSSTYIQHSAVLAAGKYLLSEKTMTSNADSMRPIFESLAEQIQPGHDIDTRRLSLVVVRTVARHHNDAMKPYLQVLAPSIFQCLRDAVIPIKLAAEAAWLEIFDVVNSEGEVFEQFLTKLKTNPSIPPTMPRIMGDYFKRVALRLAGQRREQREAEGGAGGLGLSSDEAEDEREVWSVGKVDLDTGVFTD